MHSLFKLALPLFFIMPNGCGNTTENAETCEPEIEISGEYNIETTEVSGNCGSLGSLSVTIDDGTPLVDEGLGCNEPERFWNEEVCAHDSSTYCDDGEWEMTLIWRVFPSEGATGISGELKALMSRWGGIYTCESFYKFSEDEGY